MSALTSSERTARPRIARLTAVLLNNDLLPYVVGVIGVATGFSHVYTDLFRHLDESSSLKLMALYVLGGFFCGSLATLALRYFRARYRGRKSKFINLTVRMNGRSVTVSVDVNDPNKVSKAVDLLIKEQDDKVAASAALLSATEKLP